MTEPLSPAAQAVLDAAMQYEINPECYSREIAAATLRTAADQVVPQELEPPEQPISDCNDPWNGWNAKQTIRRQILAIAAELEGK